MKYKFNYKDGRNYDDIIVEPLKIEANKLKNEEIVIKISSQKNEKVTFNLSTDEAVAIAHSLLSVVHSGFKVINQK